MASIISEEDTTGTHSHNHTGIRVLYMDSATKDLPHELAYQEPPRFEIPPGLEQMSSATDASKPEDEVYMNQEEIRRAMETRQQEIRQTFKLIKKASKVDICFLVDCTGSMQPWIDKIKNTIGKWTSMLHIYYPDCELRFAFVGYTDYDQPEKDRTKVLDFTGEHRRFYNFVHRIQIPNSGVGGDTCEDVMGGLKAALTELTWQQEGTNVLIHMADAPCHGLQYHERHFGDLYPDGDPAHISHLDMMEKVVQLNIQYWFGFIKKVTTDKMVAVLNDSLLRLSERELMICQFDASDPTKLQAAVYTTAVASIGVTVNTGLQKKTSIRPFQLDFNPPNFRTLRAKTGKKTPAVVERLREDDILLEPPSIPVSFKHSQHPFAVGGLRLAYHAYDETNHSHTVLKVFKRTGKRWNCAKRYMEVSEIQKLATSYATDFNREKPRATPKINFLNVDVIDLGKEADQRWYTMEEYTEGEYEKFNNNTGWVSYREDPISTALQAFSHYTWVKSGKKLVICDLQGWRTDRGICLTDPAIHSEEYYKYGKTNLGPKGIHRFFKTHNCNDICTRMNLEAYQSQHPRQKPPT